MQGAAALPTTGHYHLHVHTISKLKGHSIHAAAAYRRAERFEGPDIEENSVTHAAAYRRAQQLGNDGKVFDYRRKLGVAWTGIFAPDCTPKDLLDAQTLWNTVERTEYRKNARLAREMIIALPHQVDLETHVTMLRAFVNAQLVSRGLIADVAIHRPPVEHGGDPRNWHAHVLFTDRQITPNGFARTKDRMLNAKENVLIWRKAWADCHNTTMEALGMPHRIDHRSLEAQRAEALERGNTIAALDLDRSPQIHVGREVYVSRRGEQLAPRAARNRAILDDNKRRAFANKDHIEAAIARADTAAYLEARINAVKNDLWEPPEPSYEDLYRSYGRPEPTTRLGRLKHLAFAGDVTRRALAVQRAHQYPWHKNGHRHGAPSILDALLPRVKETGPGHPVFTVTAKDLAFAFYKMGICNITDLRKSLQGIELEEQRLFANKLAKRKKRPPSLPVPKPPAPPSPHAERLHRLRQAAVVPQQIYLRRLGQLNAFDRRHQSKAMGRFSRKTQRLGRRMFRQQQ